MIVELYTLIFGCVLLRTAPLFPLPMAQHLLHSGDLDVRELLVQGLFIGEIEDAFRDPVSKDREQALHPLLREIRVSSDLTWQFGDFATLQLLHAVVRDGELFACVGVGIC